jgi:hypothetical protein
VARWPLQPLYDLWDDAMALAEFDASRGARATTVPSLTLRRMRGRIKEGAGGPVTAGRSYRFVIEEVAPVGAALVGARDGSDRAATRAAPTARGG